MTLLVQVLDVHPGLPIEHRGNGLLSRSGGVGGSYPLIDGLRFGEHVGHGARSARAAAHAPAKPLNLQRRVLLT